MRCNILRSLLGANGQEQVLGSDNQILINPHPSLLHIVVVIAPQRMLPVYILHVFPDLVLHKGFFLPYYPGP